MSWGNTYTHALAYAVDLLGAALFFNVNRHGVITISSLARVAHLASEDKENGDWKIRLDSLKLWQWQTRLLLWIEPRLGEAHCEGARLGDILRARAVLDLLGAPDYP